MPNSIKEFLSQYEQAVSSVVVALQQLIRRTVPNISESLDQPAKMIHYSLGPGYKGMICTIIPSKKGIKLGFYKGSELPDPKRLLTGSGKVHRYVEIKSEKDLNQALKELLLVAADACRDRLKAG